MSTFRITRKGWMVAGFGTITLGLVAPVIAWACTALAQPTIGLNGPEAAPAGSAVTVKGGSWQPQGAIEIRWNGQQGPLLATTTGPEFDNVPITIPQVPEEDYVIMGVQLAYNENYRVTETLVARVAFSVRNPAPGAVNYGPPAGGFIPGNSNAAGHSASGSTGTASTGAATSRTAGGDTTIIGADGSRITVHIAGADAAKRARDEAAALGNTPGGGSGAGPRGPFDSISGDVWSGFHYAGNNAPSLSSPPTSGGVNTPLLMSMLAMAGALALFAGIGFVEMRRRKVRVRTW